MILVLCLDVCRALPKFLFFVPSFYIGIFSFLTLFSSWIFRLNRAIDKWRIIWRLPLLLPQIRGIQTPICTPHGWISPPVFAVVDGFCPIPRLFSHSDHPHIQYILANSPAVEGIKKKSKDLSNFLLIKHSHPSLAPSQTRNQKMDERVPRKLERLLRQPQRTIATGSKKDLQGAKQWLK